MKIAEHADHTEKLYNQRAENIHKWIDGYFDRDSFDDFIHTGTKESYDPYSHRKFRHCREALPEAVKEFSGHYTEEQITNIFECHLRDDYDGYIPNRKDFTNGKFSEKYHEQETGRESVLSSQELVSYFKGKHYRQTPEKPSLINRFRVRIILPAAVSLVLFVTAIFLIIIPMFHDSLMAEKEEMLREISSLAVSILDYYQSLEQTGELTTTEAQTAALDEVRKLRYGPENDNYFWITDMQPVMIMHPWHPELVGIDLSDYTDSMNRSGKRLFVESVELVERQGGGFLEYLWQLDEVSNRTVPKLSYVHDVEEWDWIVGTGVYIHDVEEEITRLTNNLLIVFLVLTALLTMFLLYLVYQSRIIERNRHRAETGLIEAKERYRALVEASNEGYLLFIDTSIVFSNPTFTRLTGYNEDDFDKTSIWTILIPEKIRTKQMEQHIRNLRLENPEQDEFEARIICKSGSTLEVIIRVSRIFLSERNGLILSFRPLLHTTGRIPILSDTEKEPDIETLLHEIVKSETPARVVRYLNTLTQIVRTKVLAGGDSGEIRSIIRDIFNAAVQRLVDLAIREQGEPPVPFAFLLLGSSGREELTLFSDQDNALLFKSDASGEELERQRLQFLRIADGVCSHLNSAGFSYCPGGIMAVNPVCCLSTNEWETKYRGWIDSADSFSLLDVHVYFDIACGWGDGSLIEKLQATVFDYMQERPEFFTHFARNCLQYKVPRAMFGTLRTEVRDGSEIVNIKECLIPLINFARIYALRHGIASACTLDRFAGLRDMDIIDEHTYGNLITAFESLWELRFTNQIISHGELRKVNDDLLINTLSGERRARLKEALKIISNVQTRLSYDFLGIDLS